MEINTKNHQKTVVVIGGGMAGLFAAHVLADHFEQVTVVERDDVRDAPLSSSSSSPSSLPSRSGVPQSRHVHVLLLRGVHILRRRFPGLEEELLALGTPTLNWLKETAALVGGGWLPRSDLDLIGFSVSRSLLERQVRGHLRRRENIQFRTGHRVTNLCADSDNSRITGAVCIVGNKTVTLHADLVVDASGRSSHLPRWLEELSYAAPQESTVNADVGYATRWYKVPEDWQADWKMVLLGTRFPDISGGAVVQPVEGNRWVVTLVGYAGDHPPTDEAGFAAFARRLIGPQVWEAISGAEPLTGINGYRRTENHWRHYERLKRWPQGLIALGDAVCAFNPVYAQGMTVSALSAELLDSALRGPRGPRRFGHLRKAGAGSRSPRLGLAFQKKLAKMLQTPWQLATSDDFRWAGRKAGDATIFDRFMHRYLEHLLDRIHRPDVCLTFFNVAHLVSPPVFLFRPGIALPVLWEMAKQQF